MKNKTEKKNRGSVSAAKAVGRSPRDRHFIEGRASSLATSEKGKLSLSGHTKAIN